MVIHIIVLEAGPRLVLFASVWILAIEVLTNNIIVGRNLLEDCWIVVRFGFQLLLSVDVKLELESRNMQM